MKIKSKYVLHSMGDESIVVPVEERTKEFHGVIRLNETGSFLWKLMMEEFTRESLVERLLEEYGVEEAQAEECVDAFVDQILQAGLLESF